MTMMNPNAETQEISYECRLLRHAWKIFAPDNWERLGVWRNALHLQCLRCGMVRHDAFEKNGDLATRRYDPPEGYYLKKTEAKPTTNELRTWAVKRQRRLTAQAARERAADEL